MKHESTAMLRTITNLVLDFILHFVTVYMRNFPSNVTYEQDAAQNTLCIF